MITYRKVLTLNSRVSEADVPGVGEYAEIFAPYENNHWFPFRRLAASRYCEPFPFLFVLSIYLVRLFSTYWLSKTLGKGFPPPSNYNIVWDLFEYASADISGRQRLAPACCSAGGDSGGGTGVSEKPSTSKTLEKSTKSVKKKPPTYKVMLHNDSLNKREKVVKVVDGMTMEGALAVMGEAHEHGIAVVIVCPQDEAERYCEQLRLCGLTSSIEA
eukprot:gene2959-12965_t